MKRKIESIPAKSSVKRKGVTETISKPLTKKCQQNSVIKTISYAINLPAPKNIDLRNPSDNVIKNRVSGEKKRFLVTFERLKVTRKKKR